MSAEYSSWMTAMNLSPNILASLEVLLILKICLLTSQESICNTTRSLRLSRKTSPKSASNSSKKSVKMPRTTRNSLNNSERTSSLVSTKIQATVPSLLNSFAITHQRVVKKWPALKTTFPAWNKTKKTSTSLLENQRPLLLLHLSSKPLERKAMKFFTWLTPLMSMSSNNSRNLTERNLKTAQKRVLNLTSLKTKRKLLKNAKLLLRVSALLSSKFLAIKYKKSQLDSALLNPLVF